MVWPFFRYEFLIYPMLMLIRITTYAVMAYFFYVSRYKGEQEGSGTLTDQQSSQGNCYFKSNDMQMEPISLGQRNVSRFTVVSSESTSF